MSLLQSEGQLANISYLGVDQRSEMEAFRKNLVCQSECHNNANVCLRENVSWRQLPVEAAKDCMGQLHQCQDLCKGF